jgi:hypothetical protein
VSGRKSALVGYTALVSIGAQFSISQDRQASCNGFDIDVQQALNMALWWYKNMVLGLQTSVSNEKNSRPQPLIFYLCQFAREVSIHAIIAVPSCKSIYSDG